MLVQVFDPLLPELTEPHTKTPVSVPLTVKVVVAEVPGVVSVTVTVAPLDVTLIPAAAAGQRPIALAMFEAKVVVFRLGANVPLNVGADPEQAFELGVRIVLAGLKLMLEPLLLHETLLPVVLTTVTLPVLGTTATTSGSFPLQSPAGLLRQVPAMALLRSVAEVDALPLPTQRWFATQLVELDWKSYVVLPITIVLPAVVEPLKLTCAMPAEVSVRVFDPLPIEIEDTGG